MTRHFVLVVFLCAAADVVRATPEPAEPAVKNAKAIKTIKASPIVPPDQEPIVEPTLQTEPEPNHLRGSSFAVHNTVNALSFVPNKEPTYNPAFVTAFAITPRWSFDDRFYAYANFSLAAELTRADWTNDRFYLGDLVLGGGSRNVVEIPVTEIRLSVDHSWRLPTSKASQAASLIAAGKLSGRASRSFAVLEGISIGLSGSLGKNFHKYSTKSPSHRLLDPCHLGVDDSCIDSLVGGGVRNVSWSMSAKLSASLQILEWLSVGLGLGLKHAHLYALPAPDERVSLAVEDPAAARNYFLGDVKVTAIPLDYLVCTLGLSTASPELAPDGSHRKPFINRYTALFLNLDLGLGHFIRL